MTNDQYLLYRGGAQNLTGEAVILAGGIKLITVFGEDGEDD